MTDAVKQPHRRLLEHRFVRFLLAGGLAALCNFGSRFIYNLWVDFSAAVVLAFFTGLAVGYLLNKFYVFTTSKNSTATEVLWFILINVLALVQTWALSTYLLEVLLDIGDTTTLPTNGWPQAIAHFAGIILPVFTSYIGHRYLTFRE